jgi:hypothetical protein
MIRLASLALLAAAVLPAAAAIAADPDQQEVMTVVGAIVREQGNLCTSPSAITRDAAASTPDEPVYEITCREGVYIVRVVPDMASKVTRKDN